MNTVIVIGGGASGMFAAITAAENGAKVILLEKNNRLGKKILISGKGRCNVTNSKPISALINSFHRNGKFLFTAFNTFSNEDTMEFFERLGIPLKVERGDRVFPVSDQASDIVDGLKKKMKQLHVDIRLNKTVQGLIMDNGKVIGVSLTEGEKLYADRVIVATGGMSYPGTGSNGDGYKWAKAVGHTVVTPRPALVPLESKEGWIKQLQGVSLRNVKVTMINQKGKKLAEEFGEMLFTHFGISGPVILTMSRTAVDAWQKDQTPLIINIDLKPALTIEQLDNRLLRDIDDNGKKQFKNYLTSLLPQKMISTFIELSGIAEDKVMHQINKEERKKIIELLKQFNLTISQPRPITEAIVTAGGVGLKEVSPKTMESKLVEGLFFTGEILDIDGITGGYNLQAAFSTGFLAGKAASGMKSLIEG